MNQKELKKLLHYNEKTGIFTWNVSLNYKIKIGNIAGSINNRGYRQIRIRGKSYTAHHLAWLYVHGRFPKDQIDHTNHERSDNRILNLREATNKENSKNQILYKNNKSGIQGIFWEKKRKKWKVQITLNGIQKHLGYFKNIKDAKKVRENAKVKYRFHPNHA